MNVEEAISTRRSVRSYANKEVSREKIEKIMNSVRLAPSANNKQDWRFLIVASEEKKKELYEATKQQNSVRDAPIVIAGVTTRPESEMTCDTPGGIVDVTIALDHLALKAVEEDLGTCWIGAFYQDKAKEVLGVPEDQKIVCLMTLGYPEESLEKQDKDRKDLEEIISYL
ncbi:MAG: nitroreductase family protein [Hadesarchaea archaeon]|nr:nitroreductase family protein [Hadesarchaea archaeon]